MLQSLFEKANIKIGEEETRSLELVFFDSLRDILYFDDAKGDMKRKINSL